MKTFVLAWLLMIGIMLLSTAVFLGVLDFLALVASGQTFWKLYVGLVFIVAAIIALLTAEEVSYDHANDSAS